MTTSVIYLGPEAIVEKPIDRESFLEKARSKLMGD